VKAFHAFATFVLVSMLVAPVIAHQQDAQATEIVITPESLTLEVGDTTEVSAVVKDADGNVVEGATVVFLSTARRALGVTPTGQVEAYRPGEFQIMARVPMDPNETGRRAPARVQAMIPVVVAAPPITGIEFDATPSRFYAGTNCRPDVT